MSGLNKAMLIGRLGKDPELRMTQSGKHVCSFSLATSETWIDGNEKRERTEWHRVIAWNKAAETIAKHMRKGSMMYVEGQMQTRSWDDNDGKKCYATEVVCDQFQFLGSPQGQREDPREQRHENAGRQNEQKRSAQQQNAPQYVNAGHEDDLPF